MRLHSFFDSRCQAVIDHQSTSEYFPILLEQMRDKLHYILHEDIINHSATYLEQHRLDWTTEGIIIQFNLFWVECRYDGLWLCAKFTKIAQIIIQYLTNILSLLLNIATHHNSCNTLGDREHLIELGTLWSFKIFTKDFYCIEEIQVELAFLIFILCFFEN